METTTHPKYSKNSIQKGFAFRSRNFRMPVSKKLDWMGYQAYHFYRLFKGQLFKSCTSKFIRLRRHLKGRKTKSANCCIKIDENLPINCIKRVQYPSSNARPLCNQIRTHKINFWNSGSHLNIGQIAWRSLPFAGLTLGPLATNSSGQ